MSKDDTKPKTGGPTLRPKKAAEFLGIGESTLWAHAKSDPDFPPLIKLSSRCTVIRISDLERYLELKEAQTRKGEAS